MRRRIEKTLTIFLSFLLYSVTLHSAFSKQIGVTAGELNFPPLLRSKIRLHNERNFPRKHLIDILNRTNYAAISGLGGGGGEKNYKCT